MRQVGSIFGLVALGLTTLAGGCASRQAPVAHVQAADSPALACPWLDSERFRVPSPLPGASGAPTLRPGTFVPGCAIIRFKVAADGSVYRSALRAANPLNDGPSALAALQQMRFQPARRPETNFVLRLSMQRDSAGHIAIGTETRQEEGRFFFF